MYKSIKLRIYPNEEQTRTIEQTLGTLRFLYNKYLEFNRDFQSFYKDKIRRALIGRRLYYKHIYPKLAEEYSWIPECSDKCSRQGVLDEAEIAYKRFFKSLSDFPKFKSKKKNPVRSYSFIKNGVRFDKPRMIWIPILRYVEFKDKGYYRKGVLNENLNVTSGRVIKDRYGRYYVSLMIEYSLEEDFEYQTEGLGIDMGIKNYLSIYDGCISKYIEHPWKKSSNTKLNFYQKKINRLMIVINRKIERNKEVTNDPVKIYHSHNIEKLWVKVRKYYRKIHDYMDDFIKKTISSILTRTKPIWICVEDLDISEMLENESTSHKFHDRIAKSNWYKFRTILENMAESKGCTIITANKWYPSSRKCHICGYKNDIDLSTRKITCKFCHNTYDRDTNASINLYLKGREKYAKLS